MLNRGEAGVPVPLRFLMFQLCEAFVCLQTFLYYVVLLIVSRFFVLFCFVKSFKNNSVVYKPINMS